MRGCMFPGLKTLCTLWEILEIQYVLWINNKKMGTVVHTCKPSRDSWIPSAHSTANKPSKLSKFLIHQRSYLNKQGRWCHEEEILSWSPNTGNTCTHSCVLVYVYMGLCIYRMYMYIHIFIFLRYCFVSINHVPKLLLDSDGTWWAFEGSNRTEIH